MRNSIIQLLILTTFVILIFPSCEETAEWYLGFHKQPEFFDGEEYSKVINIFGVLRPDEIEGEQQSFIRVEKTVSSKEIEFSDSLLLPDANVLVRYNDSGNGSEELNFALVESQTEFSPDVFKNNNIEVVEGKTYQLECSHIGFDTVFAETKIPKTPVILSATRNGNQIKIVVESDASAFLYEAFYNSVFTSAYVNPAEVTTTITINLDAAASDGGEVVVFAYDKNLADYFSDVTSSILNLNSYRAPYSTVEGGYGCFGSLNLTSVNIQ